MLRGAAGDDACGEDEYGESRYCCCRWAAEVGSRIIIVSRSYLGVSPALNVLLMSVVRSLMSISSVELGLGKNSRSMIRVCKSCLTPVDRRPSAEQIAFNWLFSNLPSLTLNTS